MVRASVSADDEKIGARIRLARRQRGLSQSELASSLALSFQQVQKYEKGVNRISAVRLSRIARLLGMPLGYFFEDLGRAPRKDKRRPPVSSAAELVNSVEALSLLTAFNRIRKAPLRRRCLALVQALAGDE